MRALFVFKRNKHSGVVGVLCCRSINPILCNENEHKRAAKVHELQAALFMWRNDIRTQRQKGGRKLNRRALSYVLFNHTFPLSAHSQSP